MSPLERKIVEWDQKNPNKQTFKGLSDNNSNTVGGNAFCRQNKKVPLETRTVPTGLRKKEIITNDTIYQTLGTNMLFHFKIKCIKKVLNEAF